MLTTAQRWLMHGNRSFSFINVDEFVKFDERLPVDSK